LIRVDLLGQVVAEPSTEADLLVDIAASPGGTGFDPRLAKVVGTVEQEPVDLADPLASGGSSNRPGVAGPRRAVARPDWATPWATDSQASQKPSQGISDIDVAPVMACVESSSQSASKTAQRPESCSASGAKIVVLPDPDAPVIMNTERLVARSVRPQLGHRARSLAGSMGVGSGHDWQ
jgi:hypothetical protein